jgi:hypothetical protein
MKKYLIFVLIVMVIIMTVPVRAASVGDPETQGQGKVATAIDWSYIFDRPLDFIKATRPPGHNNDKPLNFRIDDGYNLAGKISYGLFKFMDIYIKLGVAQYNLKGDVFVGGTKTVEEKLRARNAFLYGGGFKLAYEFKDEWIIGCDAQYLTSDHEMDFRATSMTTGALTSAKYYDCRMQEWHAAPYIAKKIKDLILYIGGRYSDFRLSQRKPSDPRRWDSLIFDSDYNVGVFTGIVWNYRDSLKLNVEGRFVDEAAISVSATYRF